MTKKHHRSEAWVRGHYRNGVWVEEHYRAGTTVSEIENTSRGWPINDLGSVLALSTKCWWYGEPVFFHRDENGGCVHL